MRTSAFALALAALALVGAGCTADTSINLDSNDSNETSIETDTEASGPVGYSETKANLLDGKDDYSAYTFTSTGGDCTELGFPELLSYFEDPSLKYFVVEGVGTSYRDEMVVATPSRLNIDKLQIDGQDAKCGIDAAYGTDNGTVKCETLPAAGATAETLCNGTVSITANPR